MPRLQRFGTVYHLVIPAKIVRAKRWGKWIDLDVIINGRGNLELIEVKQPAQ